MTKKIPKHISLTLSETPTIILLEISSSTTLKGTPEEMETIKCNEMYDNLRKRDSRHLKTNSIAIQTLPILSKTCHTDAVKTEKSNVTTFASNWVMFDTYNQNSKDNKPIIEVVINTVEALEKNERFFNAVLVVERLLANNNYNAQQKRFKGLHAEADPKFIQFKYTLELLWTYANIYTKNRCVTGVSFNKQNEDIIAVGYGKYFFQDKYTNGAVMIWNIKNPLQPEREYFFHSPVTCLEFSKNSPNILAVGFYNGSVNLLNIAHRKLNVIREETSSFEPVWQLNWYEEGRNEIIIACFGDGKVCRYSPELDRREIMRATKAEGDLKGNYFGRLIEGHFPSISKYVPAKCLRLHPVNKCQYLLGTSDGVIRKCSIEKINHEDGKFRGHFGTVHSIKYSPFAKKFFASCGDDFRACLWRDGKF